MKSTTFSIERPKKHTVKYYKWSEVVEYVLTHPKFPKIQDPNFEDSLHDWFTSTFDETAHGSIFLLQESVLKNPNTSGDITCVLIRILSEFGKFDKYANLKLKCIYD